MNGRHEKIIFSQEDIKRRIKDLSEEISNDYIELNPILVTVLRGAVYLLVDLTRELSVDHRLDFLGISSYGPSNKSGAVRITKDLDIDISGKHVLVIEDIVDTGLTLHYLLRMLKERGPASLKVCTLLDRTAMRIAEFKIDYRGFEIPDVFLCGYGLDYNEKYRNLPYIIEVNE